MSDKESNLNQVYNHELNNTTLEIEALPGLNVTVVGYSDMYEALKIARAMITEGTKRQREVVSCS